MATDPGAQYEPLIQGAAKAFDLDPNILRGMAQTESVNFNPDVISGKRKSPAGAIGIMQFMPDTAKRFNVDPTDPKQAIFASAQYLRENLDKFNGDYTKAVAGYNWGENRDTFNQKEWVKKLPNETYDYVKKVLGHAASRPDVTETPAEAAAPKTEAERLRASVAKIPGTETDILPTPRKEMGLVERVKDIGKGLVEIPGAMIGSTIREPIAAGIALATGRKPEEVGGQIAPVQSQFAKDVMGGLTNVLETAKVPALTPGMLTAPVRPATAATRQVAAPVANELAMVGESAQNALMNRQARVARERSAAAYQRGPQIDAAQEANRLGINLPPAESNPTLANRLTEKIVGATNIEKEVAESNRNKPTSIAKAELGISEDRPLTAATFAEARTAASKPYETIKAIPSIAADEATIGALNELRQSEALIGGKATKGKIDSLIDDAVGQVQQGLSGDNLLKNISNLRKDARTIYKKVDLSPEERVVADANIGIANALESLIEKNIAGDAKLLKEFRDARTLMAKSYAYEKATDMNTGLVDPAKLAKITAADNALTGDIAALGKVAGNYPEAFNVKPRGALERGATYLARSGLPGSVGFLVGGPVGAITGAALGKVAEKVGAKRVVSRAYQAKRVVPKDYRKSANELIQPVQKLNALIK